MQLNEWIDQVGGVDEAAAQLNESPRMVYSWYIFARAPRLMTAYSIVTHTEGAVDFNGIYQAVAEFKAAKSGG